MVKAEEVKEVWILFYNHDIQWLNLYIQHDQETT